jgi:hypothetical protein
MLVRRQAPSGHAVAPASPAHAGATVARRRYNGLANRVGGMLAWFVATAAAHAQIATPDATSRAALQPSAAVSAALPRLRDATEQLHLALSNDERTEPAASSVVLDLRAIAQWLSAMTPNDSATRAPTLLERTDPAVHAAADLHDALLHSELDGSYSALLGYLAPEASDAGKLKPLLRVLQGRPEAGDDTTSIQARVAYVIPDNTACLALGFQHTSLASKEANGVFMDLQLSK